MKNKEQQELCEFIEIFRDKKDGEAFQNLLTGLFKSPLYIPQGKGEREGQFLMAQQNDQRMMPAFTDMDETKKGNLGDVDYTPYSIEEYANIVAGIDVQGIIVNIFDKSNCIISKDFLVNMVIPAFKENRILPGLKSAKNGEYIPVHKMPFSIGRSEQADLTISDNTINELHSLLIEREGKYYVVDRESLNGVYVNGNKVDREQEIIFDDVIEFYDAEYTFVPLGIADRKPLQPTIYGDEGSMLANSMFLMQNHLLSNGFLDKPQEFIKDLEENDGKEVFRRYFLISLETTCGMREKEQKIEDAKVIEEQRKAMLAKGASIFRNSNYGFSKCEQEDGSIYIVEFPKLFHIPGLARTMYLVTKESGEQVVYMTRFAQEGQAKLIKVSQDDKETDCGDAPATLEEELQKVMELGI